MATTLQLQAASRLAPRLARSLPLGLLLAALCLVLLLWGCGGTMPPIPGPTPTATPTPTPTAAPGPLPPVQVQGNRFVPSLRGWVRCCMGETQDAGRDWTLAPLQETDAWASTRAFNLTVVRSGPYSDQGQGWSLLTAGRLRASVQYNADRGVYTIVDLIDLWAFKPQNQRYNLYSMGCDVTHQAPNEQLRRWVREVVHQTGDLPVLYNIGNEGWLCRPVVAFYDGVNSLVKQSLQDFGMPDRPVGTTWDLNQVDTAVACRYDYIEQHGFGLQSPLCRPSILTESDNDPHTPAQWRDLVAQTEAQAGTYVAIWRGPMPDDQWAQLITSYSGTPAPNAPRQDTWCLWGSGGIHTWQADPSPLDEATAQRVADALDRVRAGGYSWLWAPGQDRLACDGTPADGLLRVDFYSLVQAALGPGCSIAGNPDAANPFTMEGGSVSDADNIDVLVSTDPCQQAGVGRGLHLVVFGNAPDWCRVPRGVDGVRNAFKGSSRWTVPATCTGLPSPSPGPSLSCGALGGDYCSQDGTCPSGAASLGDSSDCHPCCKTGPPPTPPPSPAACGAIPSDVQRWRVIVKPVAGSQQVDLTPVACGPAVVAANQGCGARCCELSAEKGNQACADALYGAPFWTDQNGHTPPVSTDPRLVQVYPTNAYTMKVAEGQGVVSVCGTRDTRSCVAFSAAATVPACQVVQPPPGAPGQGCVTPAPE